MYSIPNKKNSNKGKMLKETSILDIDGFLMASKKKVFHIQGENIKNIKVIDKKLANPLVSKKVFKQYNKLIIHLTDLLVDDDEDGESCREALNQIEKFRQEIKNKYRSFLKKKELEMMSKQLLALKKEAERKFLEIQESYLEYMNSNKKGK